MSLTKATYSMISGAEVNVLDYGAVGNGVTDDFAAIQQAITNNRGKRIYFPKGNYAISAPLVINSVVSGTVPSTVIYGDGYPLGAGQQGTTITYTGSTGSVFNLVNTGDQNPDITISGMMLYNSVPSSTNVHGIYVNTLANTKIEQVHISGFTGAGIYLKNAYGGRISGCLIYGNKLYGIALDGSNAILMSYNKTFNNGTTYAQETGNVFFIPGSNCNGNTLLHCDVSFAGNGATLFRRDTGSLTSIVVSGGTATATTATAHNLANGYKISVKGATVVPSLNSIYPVTITVTGPTTFTFSTSAPNGTYTESTLKIGPFAVAVYIGGSGGTVITNAYHEDSTGLALYTSGDGLTVTGGFWYGDIWSALFLLDSCTNTDIGTANFDGSQSGMFQNFPTAPHANNYKSGIFGVGTRVTLAIVFMRDGTYYSSANPSTFTGSWVSGTYIRNAVPVVGQPKGWYCTVSGAPGTWVSEGNL
jgi:parallel beta-helix repeat protein